ncbi:MAG: hypothetical protein ACRECX_00350 [Methyloceanibacter sp.]|uniref:hypothetical protein n=1 Tax=Methyloceanibacter sp. TaxID=1965321 RepID=UPI003D6C7259
MCRSRSLIATLSLALTAGAAAPASAFQEVPGAPPAGESVPLPPALALGNPAVPIEAPEPDQMEVFGYSVPKLDFGLELLYGQEQPQLELQQGQTTFDAESDVTVLGKIKRRF